MTWASRDGRPPLLAGRVMVDELLRSIPRLWRGSRLPAQGHRALPTGFEALDRELPGGGWPIGAVVELLVHTAGIGELRLVLPVIRRLVLAGNHVLLVDPPYSPNAVLLHRLGIDLDGLLLVYPEDEADALWSAEQALRSPACGAVLAWPRGGGRVFSDARVRRLQVAAEDGQSILFLYRGKGAGLFPAGSFLNRHGNRRKNKPDPFSSWATLRLELLPAEAGLEINVLKAAGTHRRPQICVSL